MTLLEEMYQVYADCHMDNFEEADKIRNLNWCSVPVDMEEAHKAFSNACKGYNNFEPNKVFAKLKSVCADYEVKVATAREGSPALYLYCASTEDAKTLLKTLSRQRSMEIDEYDLETPKVIRLWWD